MMRTTSMVAWSCPGRFASAVLMVGWLAFVAACQPAAPADPVEKVAEDYVGLALAWGRHRAADVDGYFGPAALDTRADESGPPADELLASARMLLATAQAPEVADSPRGRRLQEKIGQYIALLEVAAAAPQAITFADEARKLYAVDLPVLDEAVPKALLKTLDTILPGTGTLPFRAASFRNQFVIPADKRQAVFERALEECRRRTLAHWQLPANETLEVEFTRDVPSAWHRYQGNGRSTLQVNPLAVAFIGASLDVACHEGYPGHHAQFVLMEAAAGAQGFAVEDTVVLLRAPDSVLREGAANYGIELVFPEAERIAFERDVLFPLAGLPTARAELNTEVHRLTSELSAAVLPVLRDYRDGVNTFNTSTFRLEREALVSSPSDLLKYVDEFGAYSVGYTVARDRLGSYVRSASERTGEDHWAVLRRVIEQSDLTVLATPVPSGAETFPEGAGPAEVVPLRDTP